jgi:hypothetical protein
VPHVGSCSFHELLKLDYHQQASYRFNESGFAGATPLNLVFPFTINSTFPERFKPVGPRFTSICFASQLRMRMVEPSIQHSNFTRGSACGYASG